MKNHPLQKGTTQYLVTALPEGVTGAVCDMYSSAITSDAKVWHIIVRQVSDLSVTDFTVAQQSMIFTWFPFNPA